MKYRLPQALAWLALYVLLALSPLVLSWLGPSPAPRGFWVELGSALGLVGLGMLCLQFFITGRFRDFALGFGTDNLLQFHLGAGVTAMVLVLLHPAVMFLADASYLSFLDPRVNLLRTLGLVPALGALILLVVLSLWRKASGLVYEWWRLIHGLLAFFLLFVGLVHTLQVGHHTQPVWSTAWVVLLAGTALGAVLYTRLYKPWRLSHFPYRVAEVVPERGETTTLVIEPIGHRGMRFDAGQYVWLTLGDTPFRLQQHPFSLSSSAEEPKRLTLTAKALGDFTGTWPEVEPGTRAFLEGPYGAFTLDRRVEHGVVLLAGGVGITPMMSILRTLAARGDRRRVILLYANPRWEEVLFREEIEALREPLDLEVVHILEEPPDAWEGEVGLLTPEVLERHLPAEEARHDYYICGPKPMMDLVESQLVRRDIPLRQIRSERFEIV